MMKKKNDTKSWVRVLCDELCGKIEEVPEGWMSLSQIKKELEMTKGEAEVFMEKAIRIGRAEKKLFKIRVHGSGARSVWHYKEK